MSESLTYRYQILTGVAGLFILGYIVSKAKYSSRPIDKELLLPPGPPGLPLIGNVHQFLGKSIASVLEQWNKEYGHIVCIHLFRTPVIIIGSSHVAKELLEARAQIYSGRPNFILASESMQDNMMLSFIPPNERHKRLRKLVVAQLRPTAISEYFHPVQRVEIHRLVNSLIEDPNDWKSYIAKALASIIMTTTYDRPIRSGQDAEQVVKNVFRLNNELGQAVESGKSAVDFLPWLRYVPFAPYKAFSRSYLNFAENTYKTLMDKAKANLEAGNTARGIAARLLQNPEEHEANYREQYWGLGSFFLAGSDTQSISSEILFMALATHPHVFKKCQAEVDSVVGPDRLPTFDDEPSLPYIRATIREVFRWRPVGPTVIPHATTENDEYMGYYIPKGAMVLPNLFSMHMDPEIFDDPETFNPQRYIDNPSLPCHTFGFGRRICPGQRMAEATFFLKLATVAWAVDVEKRKDSNGKEIEIDTDRGRGFTLGTFLKPNPFSISITPRSAERAKFLAAVVEDEGL